MKMCNSPKMVHVNSQKRHASFEHDFISLACRFIALKKKSHSLLDDPHTNILQSLLEYPNFIINLKSNSYTMGCPSVRGDNPQALASGLSHVQMDKHGITILYHLH